MCWVRESGQLAGFWTDSERQVSPPWTLPVSSSLRTTEGREEGGAGEATGLAVFTEEPWPLSSQ